MRRLEAEPQLVASGAFSHLQQLATALPRSGPAQHVRAAMGATWMGSSDWKQLSTKELFQLYQFLNVDTLNPADLSVRWSGSITPAASGEYIFRQARQYGGQDGTLKISVGGKEILSSVDQTRGGDRFQGTPVSLAGGKPVAIEVILVHRARRIDIADGAPMAVVTWEKKGGEASLIPSEAFSFPSGLNTHDSHGLRGEYFGDATLTKLVQTRIDPTLDQVWTGAAIKALYPEEAAKVLAECQRRLLREEGRQFLINEDLAEEFSAHLGAFALQLDASDRLRLVNVLLQQPEILAAIPPSSMGELTQAVYMLPGDGPVKLLGEWAKLRPQPVTQLGPMLEGEPDSFLALNVTPYWQIGRCFQGPYEPRATQLWEKYGVGPKNECNLSVAYPLSCATALAMSGSPRRGNQKNAFLSDLEEFSSDPEVSGDAKVTWLIARSYAKEATGNGKVQLLAGLQYLQEATLVAESPDHRFWALREMAARYASRGAISELDGLLEQHATRMQDPQQQQLASQWKEQATQIQHKYQSYQQRQDLRSKAKVVAELKRRQERAAARGDEARATRYEQLIRSAQTSYEQAAGEL